MLLAQQPKQLLEFYEPNFLSKLRHSLSLSSLSSPQFTRLPFWPILILFLTCATQLRNGLLSSIRTLVFSLEKIRRVQQCRSTSLTAIRTRPLAMWTPSSGRSGITSTPIDVWITASWSARFFSHFRMIVRKWQKGETLNKSVQHRIYLWCLRAECTFCFCALMVICNKFHARMRGGAERSVQLHWQGMYTQVCEFLEHMENTTRRPRIWALVRWSLTEFLTSALRLTCTQTTRINRTGN